MSEQVGTSDEEEEEDEEDRNGDEDDDKPSGTAQALRGFH